jgi:hypothetical protein
MINKAKQEQPQWSNSFAPYGCLTKTKAKQEQSDGRIHSDHGLLDEGKTRVAAMEQFICSIRLLDENKPHNQ